MKNQKMQILSPLFFCSTALSIMASSAFARPVDLPKPATDRVAPFRIIEIQNDELHALAQAYYTSVDDPTNHEIPAGGTLDGVARLILTLSNPNINGTFGCSGALLPTGMHLLTAAHCVTDENGNLALTTGTATFEGDLGNITLDVVAAEVPQKWDGDILRGNDIAVLKLAAQVPLDIARYDIDRNPDDDLSVAEKTGYGKYGTGVSGATEPFGIKHGGTNRYDALADTMLKALGLRPKRDFVPGSMLQYDFDNGNPDNDAFDVFFDMPDLGEGLNEVGSAPGDSGGPSHNLGIITGVTSYGLTLTFTDGRTSDTTPDVLDSSNGEFFTDTRVSKYQEWIDSVISDGSSDGETKCSRGQARRGLC